MHSALAAREADVCLLNAGVYIYVTWQITSTAKMHFMTHTPLSILVLFNDTVKC